MCSDQKASCNGFNLLTNNIKDAHTQTQRSKIEAFIKKSFQDFYNAEIRHFMPVLLCLIDQKSTPRAALGLRPAESSPLFLENYLERPIEQLLSKTYQQPVIRSEIIEVGNLAIGCKGDARALIIAMTAFLYAANYEFVTFTIGPVLINSFRRLGLPLADLGPDNINNLTPNERPSWGNYFDQGPRVMAGRLADAYAFLAHYSLQENTMQSLWYRATNIGSQAA